LHVHPALIAAIHNIGEGGESRRNGPF
jgi:hypothetical protein